MAIVLACGISLAACPAGQSTRCRDLCQTVVACVESLDKNDVVIDETECTITCTALERDIEGRKKVDDYATCVREAPNCEAKLDCQAAAPNPPAQ